MIKRVIGLPLSIGTGIWGTLAPRSRRLVMGSLGLGHLVGEFLPYSQKHEFEADEIGLTYMQKAEFDIHEAPKFWQRMLDAFPNQQKSDPLSTHPDSEAYAGWRGRALLLERERGNHRRTGGGDSNR